MEKKINVAEILKSCPRGMELDCTMYDNAKFDYIASGSMVYPIKIQTPDGQIGLSKYGGYSNSEGAKCVIFPKGKTTWEGFHRPFKDGDILATDLGSVFYLNTRLNNDECYGCYVGIGGDGSFHICEPFAYKECCGLATEEEKQKLFDAIKNKGYKWNAETKTLEKLIESKFKVGDRIRMKNSNEEYTIIEVNDYTCQYSNQYCSGLFGMLVQDEYELVPNKFDIGTLKPFDKVLVRFDKDDQWQANIFSHIDEDLNNFCYKYVTINYSYPCMIPYEGNEHLCGTKDNCDEFYKIW